MPRIVITAAARLGLERCRKILHAKNPTAARRAGSAIGEHLALLETSPEIGRPSPNNPHLRELILPFGDSGFLALYALDPAADAVLLLAFRHQKEAGY